MEHTLAHTVNGFCMRIIAKIAGGTFRLFLRRFFGIDTLTYTVSQQYFTSNVIEIQSLDRHGDRYRLSREVSAILRNGI